MKFFKYLKATLEYAFAKKDIDTKKIFIHGRSLGLLYKFKNFNIIKK